MSFIQVPPHQETHHTGGSDELTELPLASLPGHQATHHIGESDALTEIPLHKTTHTTGQTDPVAIAASQVVSGRFGLNRLGFTLDKLLKGAGAGSSPTEIDVPKPVISESQIFNGTCPTSWQDIDTGKPSATLLLAVECASSISGGVSFRRNGDTRDYHLADSSVSYCCSCGLLEADKAKVYRVDSDVNGLIEWKTGQARTVTVTILDSFQ